MPRKSKKMKVDPVITVSGEADATTIESVGDREWEEVQNPIAEEKKKQEKEVRVKSSSFHITVNSNQRYPTKEAFIRDLRPFYKSLNDLFGSNDNVKMIIDIMNPEDTFDGTVGSVHTEIGVEYSPVAGMHAHCLITLMHVTKLRIDIPKLRVLLDSLLHSSGLPLVGDAPYVHVRFVPDQKQTVKNYIRKHMNGKKFRMREGQEFTVLMGACSCNCQISDMSEFFLHAAPAA